MINCSQKKLIIFSLFVLVSFFAVSNKALSFTAEGKLKGSETWTQNHTLKGDVWLDNSTYKLIIDATTATSSSPLVISITANSDSQGNEGGSPGIDPHRIELIVVKGTLIIKASRSKPVIFTSTADVPQPGDWYGIRLEDGNIDWPCGGTADGCSVITWTTFIGTKNAIECDESAAKISFCTFQEPAEIAIKSTNSVDNAPFIDECTINGNDRTVLGMYVENSWPRITDNVFNNCTGSGILFSNCSFEGSFDVYRNIFKGSPYGIRLVNSSSPDLRNNLVDGYFGGVHCTYESSPNIINNTIVNAYSEGIHLSEDSHPDIRNNIISKCGYGIHCYDISSIMVNYNCFFDNYNGDLQACPGIGVGNLFGLDPLFESGFESGYCLLPESPCLDAGDPNPIYYDRNDPNNPINDIGMYGGPEADPVCSGGYPKRVLAELEIGPYPTDVITTPTPTEDGSYRLFISERNLLDGETEPDTDFLNGIRVFNGETLIEEAEIELTEADTKANWFTQPSGMDFHPYLGYFLVVGKDYDDNGNPELVGYGGDVWFVEMFDLGGIPTYSKAKNFDNFAKNPKQVAFSSIPSAEGEFALVTTDVGVNVLYNSSFAKYLKHNLRVKDKNNDNYDRLLEIISQDIYNDENYEDPFGKPGVELVYPTIWLSKGTPLDTDITIKINKNSTIPPDPTDIIPDYIDMQIYNGSSGLWNGVSFDLSDDGSGNYFLSWVNSFWLDSQINAHFKWHACAEDGADTVINGDCVATSDHPGAPLMDCTPALYQPDCMECWEPPATCNTGVDKYQTALGLQTFQNIISPTGIALPEYIKFLPIARGDFYYAYGSCNQDAKSFFIVKYDTVDDIGTDDTQFGYPSTAPPTITGYKCTGIALDPDGNFIWGSFQATSKAEGSYIFKYKLKADGDFNTTEQYSVFADAGPADMEITPNGRFLYVLCKNAESIAVIDLSVTLVVNPTGTIYDNPDAVIDVIPLDGIPQALTFLPNGTQCYVVVKKLLAEDKEHPEKSVYEGKLVVLGISGIDNNAPIVDTDVNSLKPYIGQIDVLPTTTLEGKINDDSGVVNPNSVAITVQRNIGETPQIISANINITSTGVSYFYDPLDFDDGAYVTMTIDACDEHEPDPNCITGEDNQRPPFTYSFSVADTTGPIISNLFPTPGGTNIPVTTNVSAEITDNGSGINLSSIELKLIFPEQKERSTHTYKCGFPGDTLGSLSCGIIPNGYKPVFSLKAGQQFPFWAYYDPSSGIGKIEVNISAKDTGNINSTKSFSFTTLPDPEPVLWDMNPLPDQPNVPTETNIYFKVTDCDYGINQASLAMYVDSIRVFPVITPLSGLLGYEVKYDPEEPFVVGQVVEVEVKACDLHPITQNCIDYFYNFTVGEDIVAPTVENFKPIAAPCYDFTLEIKDNQNGSGVDDSSIMVKVEDALNGLKTFQCGDENADGSSLICGENTETSCENEACYYVEFTRGDDWLFAQNLPITLTVDAKDNLENSVHGAFNFTTAKCSDSKGDVDKNGHVEPNDALLALQIYLEILDYDQIKDGYKICAGDMNNDCKVEPWDAWCILVTYVGLNCY